MWGRAGWGGACLRWGHEWYLSPPAVIILKSWRGLEVLTSWGMLRPACLAAWLCLKRLCCYCHAFCLLK